MKFKLSGLDRLIIPKLFAERSGLLEQVTVREINEIIKIQSNEFSDFGLVEDKDKLLTWDGEKIKIEKEFDLTKPHTTLLKSAVDKKDKANEITQQILETCLKIQKMR